MSFELGAIAPIREDDIYGGYRLSINARYDTILTPLTIDISIGDVITPNPVKFAFTEIFDQDKSFELWAYNIETVLAEKIETILRRGVFNTRPRDFYDTYILLTTQRYDKAVFQEVLQATAEHRSTTSQIEDANGILKNISESAELKAMWEKYRRQFAYAKGIEFVNIIETLRRTTA